MSLPRSMLAGVGGEKPRRPQSVRIAAVLGLATGQIDASCLSFNRSGGFGPAGSPGAANSDRLKAAASGYGRSSHMIGLE